MADDTYDLPPFLEGEECERCKGPFRAEGYTKTIFIEETGDYVSQTFWSCYMCGHEQSLGSNPYFAI